VLGSRAVTRRLPIALAFVLLACRSGSASSSTSPSPSSSTSALASTPEAPSNHPVTLLDLPVPASQVVDAQKEYALGVQDMHENNWAVAVLHFQKAAQLDPSMAEAHLRTAMMMIGARDPSTKKEEFAKANALRTRLPHRDRLLLDALEPVLGGADEDVPEAVKRLEALAGKRPLDAEVFLWLSTLQNGLPSALAPAEKAIELDPTDPQPLSTKGAALLVLGKFDEARAAYARCGAVSADNPECFLWAATTDSLEGRCEGALHEQERYAEHTGAQGLSNVLGAQAAAGRALDVLSDTTAKAKAAAPEHVRDLFGGGLDASLAIFEGDFAHAREVLTAQSARIAANPSARTAYVFHYLVTGMLVGVALETGDAAGAESAARDFMAQSGSWTRESGLDRGADRSLVFARLAAGSTKAPGPDFQAAQSSWVEARRAARAYPGVVWTNAYAAPALTRQEAEAALAKLADFAPLTSINFGPIDPLSLDGDIGHVYLLARKVDDALPYLTREDASCNVFWSPFVHMRATLDLGTALEAKGDKAGACGAYEKILDRWGKAKPRSVTADMARERVKALKCG
jgi:eukaryotic-like serine/threonine-protein kinase